MVEVAQTDNGTPCGHTCPKCGKQHRWPDYVFAHWNEDLTHTCDCGNTVFIRYGRVREEE